jgi:hypothetical protein
VIRAAHVWRSTHLHQPGGDDADLLDARKKFGIVVVVYVVAILLSLLVPVVAIILYPLIAIFLFVPLRISKFVL